MSDRPARVRTVEVLEGRRVRVSFTDGLARTVDLSPLLWGPVFAQVREDDATFAAVQVDPELGTLVWPGGVDVDPDVLHGDHKAVDHPATAA
ncbi:MAG: DUF2442 domain-containing protein [Streptosporangiaceae bacterium]